MNAYTTDIHLAHERLGFKSGNCSACRDLRCHECGSLIEFGQDQAEVYLDRDTIAREAGGQWVMVDDIPDEAFGPFQTHAECYLGAGSKYTLA